MQGNRPRLLKLCEEVLTDRKLILASNRGPVEYQVGDAGELRPRRNSGGAFIALANLGRSFPLAWVGSAMGEGDHQAAQKSEWKRFPSPFPGDQLLVRFVTCPRNAYHKHYNIFCNPLLWFLHHYMWNAPHTPTVDDKVYDAWQNGYVVVNRAFAEAIVDEARGSANPPLVLSHDYHLYLVPGMVRREMPRAILQHFVHVPWPAPDSWQVLPQAMRTSIMESLCSCNIVGFQAQRDVRNFLHTCQEFLPGAEVDFGKHLIWHRGRLTLANSYPLSVDVADLQKLARSPRVRAYEEKLKPYCGEVTIARIDRAEPSKNIVRGFRAFDILLERHPELVGKVKFLAFLVPSHAHLSQYQRYSQEIMAVVNTINSKYAHTPYQPISLFFENNYPQAIAGMRLYDVLLVNSVADGMNLVAKEGPVVNLRDGVVVLSEVVGGYEQLRDNALVVAPTDLEATMEALYQAVTMPPPERKRRADALRRTIEEGDITTWLYRQFEDLRVLACQLPLLAF